MRHVHGCRIQMLGHTSPVDEVRLLTDQAKPASFVAVYRQGTRIVGLVAVNHPRVVAKSAGLLDERMPWDEAIEAVTRMMAPKAPAPAC
ncbi:oxidoreductase C-terminal domain-containing protein [Nocardia sp. NPDC051900]|uniref:oxidoreductase C-terminal domain-containing protein n=1 Tax=Nocardia sp. NPDC051900 TaxID=3364326 RepID=UPI0037AE1966